MFDIHNIKDITVKSEFKKINRANIFILSAYFQEQAYLYKKTAITESSAISTDTDIVINCEDMTQVNALYKSLGRYYSEHNKDFSDTNVMLSAKVDSALIKQLIKLDFPAIISRTAPTKQAVDTAVEHYTSLYGFSRGRRFNHYTTV